MLAYRSGIFPMADHRTDDEIYWVEPRKRAILPLGGFHLSASLAKLLKQDRLLVTCDHAFDRVIAQCATPREEHAESWISRRIEASYRALHREGHAHSIEVWEDGALVGGLYGVAFDQVFCGESMFSRRANASKVALAWLVAAMRRAGFRLLDCQFMTEHLATLGAISLPQSRYLQLLAQAGGAPRLSIPQAVVSFSCGVGEAEGAVAGAAGAGDALARGAGRAGRSAAPESGVPSSPGKAIVQSLTQTS